MVAGQITLIISLNAVKSVLINIREGNESVATPRKLDQKGDFCVLFSTLEQFLFWTPFPADNVA